MVNIILSIFIWLVKTLLVPILPVSIPFFTIATFTGYLDAVEPQLIFSLSGIGQIVSISLLFTLISVVIYAELLLVIFKASVFLINIGRGSGA